VDRAAQREEGAAVLAELGIRAGTEVPVRRLSLPVRHLVEFARERSRGDLRLLLLDEPTSCLNRGDSDTVLDAVRTLAARGTGVLFVSHKISEAIALADRMVVLRDGAVAGIFSRRDADERTLVRAMFGGDLFAVRRTPPGPTPNQDPTDARDPPGDMRPEEPGAFGTEGTSGERRRRKREGRNQPAVPAGGKTAEEAPPVLAFEKRDHRNAGREPPKLLPCGPTREILGVTSLLGQGKGAFRASSRRSTCLFRERSASRGAP
jgi:energy-coupling factor transporter ATP-binding protein EcfA2